MNTLKMSSYDWDLKAETDKYNGAFQVGDLISFKTASATHVNGAWTKVFYKGVIQYKQQLGFFVIVDSILYELRKLIDITVLNK